jgi:glycosyltransferase involved in cell wall biosynthesis
MPRVSVIIPVYNGAATVATAIESALAQDFGDFEIIAVNDGSTDNSLAILERYLDRVRVLSQPNGGISAARNTAVAASRAEYLAFLDCDDLWQPTFLSRTVAALDADRRCVLAFTDLAMIDSVGRPLNRSLVGNRAGHAPSFDEMFTRLWPIMPSAVLMRREIFARVGGFSEQFRGLGYEDVWMWMLAREQGPFAYVTEPLVTWRFAMFPEPLKTRRKPREAGRIFTQLVHDRWGIDARPLLRSRERAYRSIFGYIGLQALADGDRASARQAFSRALRIDPMRLRNYLRYARTFLPASLARALTGSSSRARKTAAHSAKGSVEVSPESPPPD